MDVKLELISLLILQGFGSSFFAPFEVQTPGWRKFLKWMILDAVTIGLYYLIGHYSLLFPTIILLIGTIFHFRFCKKNGINPWNATPRKRYYELRGWKWGE